MVGGLQRRQRHRAAGGDRPQTSRRRPSISRPGPVTTRPGTAGRQQQSAPAVHRSTRPGAAVITEQRSSLMIGAGAGRQQMCIAAARSTQPLNSSLGLLQYPVQTLGATEMLNNSALKYFVSFNNAVQNYWKPDKSETPRVVIYFN